MTILDIFISAYSFGWLIQFLILISMYGVLYSAEEMKGKAREFVVLLFLYPIWWLLWILSLRKTIVIEFKKRF
jgi:hypothetical protein